MQHEALCHCANAVFNVTESLLQSLDVLLRCSNGMTVLLFIREEKKEEAVIILQMWAELRAPRAAAFVVHHTPPAH